MFLFAVVISRNRFPES